MRVSLEVIQAFRRVSGVAEIMRVVVSQRQEDRARVWWCVIYGWRFFAVVAHINVAGSAKMDCMGDAFSALAGLERKNLHCRQAWVTSSVYVVSYNISSTKQGSASMYQYYLKSTVR